MVDAITDVMSPAVWWGAGSVGKLASSWKVPASTFSGEHPDVPSLHPDGLAKGRADREKWSRSNKTFKVGCPLDCSTLNSGLERFLNKKTNKQTISQVFHKPIKTESKCNQLALL